GSDGGWKPFRIGQSILDRLTHGRGAKLCHDRSVNKFHHGMHDRLGMDHDVELFWRDIEKPSRFDHVQALVHECCGIGSTARSHPPRWMVERFLGRDLIKSIRWSLQ